MVRADRGAARGKLARSHDPALAGDSTTGVSVRLALALAERHLSGTSTVQGVPLRAAAALCSGELSSWTAWEKDELDEGSQSQIATLLRYRPRRLASTEEFLSAAAMLDMPEYVVDGASESASPRHGRVVPDVIEDLVPLLAKASSAVRRAPARKVFEPGPREVWIDSQRYALEVPAVPADADPIPTCEPAPAAASLTVSLVDLRATAEALVSAGRGSHLGRVNDVVETLVDAEGDSVASITITAGTPLVASAPTGSGKSVLLRVLASHLAMRERTVTLVVPDTASVVALVREIEGDLAALRSDAVVAGLVSPQGAMEHFRRRATDPDCDPDELRWVGERWAYACSLGGAIDGPQAWQVGAEPCQRCPLQSRCAKFAEQRRAVPANILVVNHHNFVAGRLRLPVEVDGEVVEGMPVSELVMRRSDLLCVDEVDHFQEVVGELAASTLKLTQGQEVHHSLRRLHDEAGPVIAESLSPAARRRFHTAWTHLTFLITSYVAGCVGELAPFDPKGRRLRRLVLPGRHDPVLALRMAGRADTEDVTPEDLALLYGLDADSLEGVPADLFTAGSQVRSLVKNDDGVDRLTAVQASLLEVLEERIPNLRRRSNTVDLLIHRAYLHAIASAIQRLSMVLGELRDVGIASVGDIENGLGRLVAWQLAPWGLLGQMRMAFSVPAPPEAEGDDDLTVRAVAGDPHEYVAELGRSLALTQCGARRPVLAVSATAYLPGAATTHVHRPVGLAIPDDPDAPVDIALRHVIDSSGAPVRVSGLRAGNRDDALAELGVGLWRQHIDAHLEALKISSHRAERARVLVVANSYQQLNDLAEGMVAAGCPRSRLLIATPDSSVAAPIAVPTGTPTVAMSRFRMGVRDHPDSDVLFAPLSRVSRGLNLVIADGRAAISSIWLSIRPVPLVDEPARLLAHAGAHARHAVPPGEDFATTLARRRSEADRHLRSVLNSRPEFSCLPIQVRLDLTATVVVELIQLLGRARRGGTDAELNLVDGAFLGTQTGRSGWPSLIAGLRDRWERDGSLPLLRRLYGGTLDAVLAIADYGDDREAGAC